jgi:prevent-host-death family protein
MLAMDSFSVAETKAHLSNILDRIAAGERVTVTRRGIPIAIIAPVAGKTTAATVDWQAIAEFRKTLPKSHVSAATLIRKMRDAGY